MKIAKNLSLILIGLLLLFGCAQQPVKPQLLKSMAELDRAYVPALVFTGLERQRESELSVARLKKKWQEFYDTYYGLELKYGVDIKDIFWQENFNDISQAIVSAEVLVSEERLEEAHERLEVVRQVLKELRQRHGLPYFLDGMTGFDRPMQEMIRFLRGKDRLTDRDLKILRSLFRQAQGSWNELMTVEIDPGYFGFDREKIKAIKARLKEEERGLADLAAALATNNPDRIFQSVQDLKPNFMVLLKAFGDFQPIFDQVIKERKEAAKEAARQKEATRETGSKQEL
jgi:hypothetical protein